jgi:VanZ family protein
VRETIPFFSCLPNFFLSPSTWRRWACYVLPLLAYATLIYYESSQSRWLFEPPDFFAFDKICHFLEYAIFGVLLARVLKVYGFPPSLRGKIIGVLVFSFLYGTSDEFHQWFVPGRSATFGDLLADSLGGGLGGFIFLVRK